MSLSRRHACDPSSHPSGILPSRLCGCIFTIIIEAVKELRGTARVGMVITLSHIRPLPQANAFGRTFQLTFFIRTSQSLPTTRWKLSVEAAPASCVTSPDNVSLGAGGRQLPVSGFAGFPKRGVDRKIPQPDWVVLAEPPRRQLTQNLLPARPTSAARSFGEGTGYSLCPLRLSLGRTNPCPLFSQRACLERLSAVQGVRGAGRDASSSVPEASSPASSMTALARTTLSRSLARH